MGLFGKKESRSPGLIGVDVGAGGIKAVELIPESGKVRLATYGYSQIKNFDTWTGSLLDDPKKGAEILLRIHKESGMKSMRANASLPSQHVFHAIITIPQPKDAKENLKPMIEAQVRKLLPQPIENMILDSLVIDKQLLPKPIVEDKKAQALALPPPPQESKHIRVLVSGAPKELVGKYLEIFKLAKIELVSLETEAFALIRSLIGNDKARVMIVDIGYERTNITIVYEGIPYLHRSIKTGGGVITSMLAKQTGVTMAEAEQMKVDLASATNADVPQVLKDAMMPILHEIRYSLELFGAQDFHEHNTVEKIILTGGSARLPYIDPFLTEALNINVYIGDPWARIAVPAGLRPVLDEIGPRFSVAAGLAMKLLPEKKEK
ncbi:MAG: type IV pilus assembly protein PilM [Patescibacteria group bacterium]|jgi:type IV pilus assembly protein PilM